MVDAKEAGQKTGRTKTLADRVHSMDRRYMWWFLTILVATMLVIDISIPLKIGDETKEFVTFMDSFKRGSVILFSNDNTVTVNNVIGEACTATMRYLLERGVKIVFMSLRQDGVSLTLASLRSIPTVDRFKYGVDYVQFGYYAGDTRVVAALQRDVWGTLGADVRGTACKDIPLMQNIKQCTDFAAWIESGGGSQFTFYINNWSVPYNVPGACIQTAANLPDMTTWYRNRLLNGFVSDQTGSAALSRVLGYPSGLGRILNAQSAAHVLLIALILVGNLLYVQEKLRNQRREK